MKRIISIVLALVMLFVFASCTTSEEPKNEGQNDAVETDNKVPEIPKEPDPEPVVLESEGDLEDYHVAINGFELSEDYEGKPAIVISYTFTNNAEESESAMFAISDNAFQNGVSLERAIMMEDSADDEMKEIKPGTSIDLNSAFVLSSDTAPVIYETEAALSFEDAKLGKIFVISENGETVLSKAPEGVTSANLGDFNVSVVSYETGKDYEGKDALIVHYGFTNNGDRAASFWVDLDCTLFQDGVELESAIMFDGDSAESQMKTILPGAGIKVTEAYVLTGSSPVDIEVTESFSFSDDKLTAKIELS